MASTLTSEDDLQDEVDSLRRALNGLRREHRELKETVEDEVLSFVEEEQDVLTGVGDYVEAFTEVMTRIDLVDDKQERLDNRIERLETRSDDFLTEEEHAEEREELEERLRKLETRVSLMAERVD
ncbi:MAG: hypothetical protein SVW02_01465 [Candidatus Nanohaloarchaea archaeon]|nr:hypothetical protein [Candidatus Nanohaloarchaea archaeon]